MRVAARRIACVVALGASALACSNQGEGDQCEFTFGESSDCEVGLVCQPLKGPDGRTVGLCCPEPRMLSSKPQCRMAENQVSEADSGTAPTTDAEAMTDAGSDATD